LNFPSSWVGAASVYMKIQFDHYKSNNDSFIIFTRFLTTVLLSEYTELRHEAVNKTNGNRRKAKKRVIGFLLRVRIEASFSTESYSTNETTPCYRNKWQNHV
jgi:hypothetical protein